MAFPADYTLLGDLEFPSVTGSHTDFVALIKYDDLTASMLSSIDNGGGDLRFSSDAAGTTQLACEVVEFDTVGNSVQVWVKVPSAATGNKFYIWGDNTGDSQPAVTDTYGRNAVWSDYDAVFHFLSGSRTVDSTGNYSITETGTVTSITGQIGDGVGFFENANNYDTVSGYTPPSGDAARTFSFWARTSNTEVGLFEYGVNLTSNRFGSRIDSAIVSGGFRTEIQGSYAVTNDAFNDGNWHRFVSKVNGNSAWPSCYTANVDGTDRALSTGSNTTINTSSVANLQLRQHLISAGNNPADRDEFRVQATHTSSDFDLTEYQNQSSVGAYFTATDAGGGGITVTGSTANYNYNGISGTVDLAGTIEVTGQTANYNYSGINGIIDLTPEITVIGQTGNYNYTGVQGSVLLTGLIEITGQTANYDYNAIQGQIQLSGEILVTGGTANYNYSAIPALVNIFDVWSIKNPVSTDWNAQASTGTSWTIKPANETIWSKK